MKYIKFIDLSLTLIFAVPNFFHIPKFLIMGYSYRRKPLSQSASSLVIDQMKHALNAIRTTIRCEQLESVIWRIDGFLIPRRTQMAQDAR